MSDDRQREDDGPEAAPRWSFDPDNPPNEWTKELIGQLSFSWIKRLSEPDNGILNEAQQESFDAAHAEWNKDLSERLKPALDAAMPKMKIPDVVSPALRETMRKIQADTTKPFRIPAFQVPKFEMPAVESLRRLSEQQSHLGSEMEAISDSIAEANRRKEDRADAQAQATIEIADAQKRLQELQTDGLELARQQAAASAEIAQAQQAVLGAVTEELAVLKEQTRGQRELIHSGWVSGVVMEWTLFVAMIAAVATVVLGTVTAADVPQGARVGAIALVVLTGATLAVWQWRRRPPRSQP